MVLAPLCSLSCWILLLLPYAFGYVAPTPNQILQSAQAGTLNTHYATNETSLDSAYSESLREDAPLAFKCEYWYKQNGAEFDRYAFYNSLLEAIAGVAESSWNEDIARIQWEPTYGILMRFINDRSGPGLLVKHVVWALDDLFDILVEHDRYSIGTIVVNSDWDAGRLAIGSIVTSKGPKLAVGNTTNGHLIPEIQRPDIQYDNTSSSQPLAPDQESHNSANLTLGGAGVSHVIYYKQNGAVFQDVQVYNASLKVMLEAVQINNQHRVISPAISTFNDLDGFTMGVRPYEYAKHGLAYNQAVHILAYMAQDLNHYRELSVLVSFRERPVGIICIDKGDRTKWDGADLCQPPVLSNGSGGDDIATA